MRFSNIGEQYCTSHESARTFLFHVNTGGRHPKMRSRVFFSLSFSLAAVSCSAVAVRRNLPKHQ